MNAVCCHTVHSGRKQTILLDRLAFTVTVRVLC
jgi:hypothetical protein